uniref:UV-stimulated scaffold protein A isoform X2 n=1 Tax=Myxine glutinosa TaxID=7769 RepID=UPI00358E2CA4
MDVERLTSSNPLTFSFVFLAFSFLKIDSYLIWWQCKCAANDVLVSVFLSDMDLKLCERLSELVEQLTTRGEPQPSPVLTKELKKICRLSDEYVRRTYELLLEQLNQKHSQVRLSALQLCDELFTRSHCFRLLLLADFRLFLGLTAGAEEGQPLPPPRDTARMLRRHALFAIRSWNEKFGANYRKLALGYDYLHRVKKIDFHDVEARSSVQRHRVQEQQQRQQRINQKQAEQAIKQMDDMWHEIQNCLAEFESCFQLLLPAVSDFEVVLPDQSHTTGNCAAGPMTQEGCNPQNMSGTVRGNPNKDAAVQNVGCLDEEVPCCSKTLSQHPGTTDCARIGSSYCGNGGDEDEEEDDDDGYDDDDEEYKLCQEDSTHEGGENGAKLGKQDCTKRAPGLEREESCCAVDVAGDGKSLFVKQHGLLSHTYNLQLEIPTKVHVHETEDNSAVLCNLRDLHALLTTRYLPCVHAWLKTFSKAGIAGDHLRRAVKIKSALEACAKKLQGLDIREKPRQRIVMKGDESDSGSDFEDVPEKDGYEPFIPEHLRAEYGLDPKEEDPLKADVAQTSSGAKDKRQQDEEDELDPTTAASSLKAFRLHQMRSGAVLAGQSISKGDDQGGDSHCCMSQAAPTVSYGFDLANWGQESSIALPTVVHPGSLHRFWAPLEQVEEMVLTPEAADLLKARTIPFPGSFQPVAHQCLAPRPDGSFCSRQDRFKCPFHGKIVPRDDQGNPTNPEDRARIEKEQQKKEANKLPAWRDPVLLREVEAATGEDLGSAWAERQNRRKGSGCTKGKAKRKKYPNLVDLKQLEDTSRRRLEKKVFNRARELMKCQSGVKSKKLAILSTMELHAEGL